MAGRAARYDRIADFYDATAGKVVTDRATAALLDLVGDVSGRRLLDVACGQGRVAPGFRGKVGSNHRMLSTYLNCLADRGFVLERAAEPRPGADWQQRLPGAAPVPLYFVARYQRAEGTRCAACSG